MRELLTPAVCGWSFAAMVMAITYWGALDAGWNPYLALFIVIVGYSPAIIAMLIFG